MKTNRTAAIVIHVTPELKARLEKAAEFEGLKLSPYCFRQLKVAEDSKLAFRKDAFETAMRPLGDLGRRPLANGEAE